MAKKVSQYTTQATVIASGDLIDLTKLISTGPNVYESQKADANLLARWNLFGQDQTMSAPRLHNLGNNQLSLTNGRLLLKGSDNIATDLLKLESLAGTEVFKAQNDGTIKISNAFTLPTSDGTTGQALITNGSGAVSFGNVALNNIYTANDSLTGDRILNLNSNKLEFKDSTNANSLLILDDNTRATISNTVAGIFAQYAGSSQTGKLSITSTSVIVNAEKFETKNESGSHTSLDINSNHTNGKISVNNGTGTQLVWSTHNFTLTNAGTRVIRNGQNKAFFTNAFTVFGIDSTTTVAGEDISLQGETVVQGVGTTTGTTLALYDNDTTPNKNAEFKDNGNISFYNLPTSASGLSSGDVWNDGGTLKIV